MITTGTKPAEYKSPSDWSKIEVNIPMQMLRIREHCFQPDVEYPKTVEIELENGESVTTIRWEREPRCPQNHTECEIYKDHLALKLDPALLPCCGAPIPNEDTGLEIVDEIEIVRDLQAIFQTEEIFLAEEEEEEDLEMIA